MIVYPLAHARAIPTLRLAKDISAAHRARGRDFRRLDALSERGLTQALRLHREIQPHLPLKHLPDRPHFRTIEIGAGVGDHLEFGDLSHQD